MRAAPRHTAVGGTPATKFVLRMQACVWLWRPSSSPAPGRQQPEHQHWVRTSCHGAAVHRLGAPSSPTSPVNLKLTRVFRFLARFRCVHDCRRAHHHSDETGGHQNRAHTHTFSAHSATGGSPRKSTPAGTRPPHALRPPVSTPALAHLHGPRNRNGPCKRQHVPTLNNGDAGKHAQTDVHVPRGWRIFTHSLQNCSGGSSTHTGRNLRSRGREV